MWAEIANVVMLTGIVLAFVMTMNAYPLPAIASQRLAEARGLAETPNWVHGIAVPVVVVAVLRARHDLCGARHDASAATSSPSAAIREAAELSGIDTRRMTVYGLRADGRPHGDFRRHRLRRA